MHRSALPGLRRILGRWCRQRCGGLAWTVSSSTDDSCLIINQGENNHHQNDNPFFSCLSERGRKTTTDAMDQSQQSSSAAANGEEHSRSTAFPQHSPSLPRPLPPCFSAAPVVLCCLSLMLCGAPTHRCWIFQRNGIRLPNNVRRRMRDWLASSTSSQAQKPQSVAIEWRRRLSVAFICICGFVVSQP